MDLATLGIKIDASSTDVAKDKLNQLTETGAKTEAATKKLEKATGDLSNEFQETGGVVAQYNAQIAAAQAQTKAHEAETNRLNDVTKSLAAGTKVTGSQIADMAEKVGASETKIVSVKGATAILEAELKRLGATIGVTGAAAEGLLGILSLYAAPLILIAQVVGVAVGGFAIASREMRNEVGNVTDTLNLTDAQLKRTWQKGTDDFITFGDTYHGFIATVKDTLVEAFAPQIEWMTKKFDELWNFIVKSGSTAVYNIIGLFSGAYSTITATWSQLPAAFGDILVTTANNIIGAIERTINNTIDRINDFSTKAKALTGLGGGQIDRVAMYKIPNANAGAAAGVAASAEAAYKEGDKRGREAVDKFWTRWTENSRKAAEARIREDAGEPGAEKKAKKPKQETDKLAAWLNDLVLDNQKLIAKNNEENERVSAKAMKSAEQMADKIKLETDARKQNAEQQAVSRAEYDLERAGIVKGTTAYFLYADSIVAAARAQGQLAKAADDASYMTDRISDLNDSVHDATSGLKDLFGTAGEGFGSLLNGITDYAEKSAKAFEDLAEAREKYGEDSEGFARESARITKRQSQEELNSYGNIIHGVKGLFKEKSAAYKVMEGIEKAYAIFKVAMAVREILTEGIITTAKVGGASARMAADATETASSVANNTVRATSSGITAFANALKDIPFPFNLAAGAAVLAALVAVGVKVAGGGGGGGGKASSKAAKEEVRPTDYSSYDSPYSVGRTGSEGIVNGGGSAPLTDNRPRSGGGSGGLTIAPSYVIHANGADNGTVATIRDMLAEHTETTVDLARQAVAQDQANMARRQNLGGVG